MMAWVELRPNAQMSAFTLAPASIAIRLVEVTVPTEQHGQEEQAAAEEDGGEQTVLDDADLLAHDPDEPEEGDAGERDEMEADADLLPPGCVGLQGLQSSPHSARAAS